MAEAMAFELTEVEQQCGVAVPQVLRESGRALLIDGGEAVVMDRDLAPALAGAAARHRLGGAVSVSFACFNGLGLPVCRKEDTAWPGAPSRA